MRSLLFCDILVIIEPGISMRLTSGHVSSDHLYVKNTKYVMITKCHWRIKLFPM